jgi:hypothetical protein
MRELEFWIDRHLNWTAVFVAVCSVLIGYVTISFLLFIGLPDIPYPGGNIIAQLDLANAISIFCFAWVLRQKKRSLWFLLFFVPPFVPTFVPFFTIILFLTFWVAGFIILLCLRNMPIKKGKVQRQ